MPRMNTEKISEKIDELRNQIVANASMCIDLARSDFEYKKAKEQGIKLREAWNEFLEEWTELRKELQIKDAIDRTTKESTEEKKEFAKISKIVKKAF